MSLSSATMPVKFPGQARLISATAAARKNLHCGKTPDKALCVEDYDDGAGNAGAGSGEDKDEQEHDDRNSVFSLLVGCSGENCSERCVKLLSCWFINVSSIPISVRKFWSQHSRAFAKKWLGQGNQKETCSSCGLFWYHGVFFSFWYHQSFWCLIIIGWLSFPFIQAMKQKFGSLGCNWDYIHLYKFI